MFITAFTSARHLSLFWASSIQSILPHPASWRFILILSSHLRLGLPSGLFHSGFPTITLYTPLFSPIRATYPTHPILLDFITRKTMGDQYRSLSFSLCSFLHSPVTSNLLGPNILLNTLLSNTRSLRSWVNVTNQVSHPYKKQAKVYKVIKKSLCTWWLQYRKLQIMLPHYLAQSDCLAADRQGQGDTRLTLTPSVIPNSNYVIMVSDWNCLKYFCVFFCTVLIRCTETFWSRCSSVYLDL
jgi:hypothetical protein